MRHQTYADVPELAAASVNGEYEGREIRCSFVDPTTATGVCQALVKGKSHQNSCT